MCCLWLCRSLSLYLTRVKMNVGMFAAVAAFCGSHQCSRVCPSTVKFYSAGGVIGGTGCYVAVLSCHLNSVETCLTSLRPGEIPLVGPTVHMSSEVGWLTWDWRRKADFRLGFFMNFYSTAAVTIETHPTCAYFYGWAVTAAAGSILYCDAESISLSTQQVGQRVWGIGGDIVCRRDSAACSLSL